MSDHLIGENGKYRERALINEQKILEFLRLVGDPDFQIRMAKGISINQSTVPQTVGNVKTKLHKSHIWIKFSSTNDELQRA